MERWRLHNVTRWLAGLALLAAHGHLSGISAQPPIDPFADFQILTIPRSHLPIGAPWVGFLGSINQEGLPPELISVDSSYSIGAINQSTAFRSNVINLLAKSLNISNQASTFLAFTGMQVLTVKNLYALNLNSGATYIWEGVRLTSFTVADTSGLKANLKTLGSDKALNFTFLRDRTYEVTGVNLFVGYRLLKIERDKPRRISSWNIYDKSPKTTIDLTPSDYTIQFRVATPADSLAILTDYAAWPAPQRKNKSCRAVMTATVPTEPELHKSWLMQCLNSNDDDTYTLSIRPTANGVCIDKLTVREFRIHPELSSGGISASGAFIVDSTSIQLAVPKIKSKSHCQKGYASYIAATGILSAGSVIWYLVEKNAAEDNHGKYMKSNNVGDVVAYRIRAEKNITRRKIAGISATTSGIGLGVFIIQNISARHGQIKREIGFTGKEIESIIGVSFYQSNLQKYPAINMALSF
jgi:hypothetical protein